eukprot:tig00001001_g6212.t1
MAPGPASASAWAAETRPRSRAPRGGRCSRCCSCAGSSRAPSAKVRYLRPSPSSVLRYGVSFAETTAGPFAGRYNHGVVSYRAPDQRPKIAVVGGSNGYPNYYYEVWIMDVETAQWTQAPVGSPKYNQVSCVWDLEQTIYCTAAGSIWSFDTNFTSYTQPFPAPNGLEYHAMTFFNGSIWVAGGQFWSGGVVYISDLIYRYSLSSRTWATVTPVGPSPWRGRAVHKSLLVGSRWYLFEGQRKENGSTVYPSEILELDLAGGGPKTWRAAGSINAGYGSALRGLALCNGLFLIVRTVSASAVRILLNPADGKEEFVSTTPLYIASFPIYNTGWAGFGSTCTLFVSCGSIGADGSSRTFKFQGTLAPLTASWTQPAPGGSSSVLRGASVNVSHSALSRAFGPAVLYLVSSSAQLAPVQYQLLSGVILYSAGGTLSVQLPAAVNGGQYFFHFSMADADGGSLDTPTFAVESWRLLELAPQVDGLELFANGSVTVSWTSAAWPFHADVYLLPSAKDKVLSWTGDKIDSFYVEGGSGGGNRTFLLPNATWPGDYVIRIADAGNADLGTHSLTPYIVVLADDGSPSLLLASIVSSSVSATSLDVVASFSANRGISILEVNCTADSDMRPFSEKKPAYETDARRTVIQVTLPPRYAGPYSINCTCFAVSSDQAVVASVSLGSQNVQAARPWTGQSVAALELACEGFGGPYAETFEVSDAGASGTALELAVAPSYTGGYRLACSALARASTGLASEASAFAVDVPAAAPSAPSSVAVSVENATRVTAVLRFTPGQSVARAELNCSGHGGPYAAFASVNASDGAAAEASVALTVAPKYSGNYTLACTALVRGSTGLPSALAVPSGAVWVPAASPWGPLQLAVSVENATRATAVLSFTPGQSVAWAEVNCSGDGRLYSLAAAVNASDGAVAGANVSLTVEPKYSGNYSLTCTALVRASTGLQSAAVTYSDIATIPPASPWRPFIKSAAATNATRISVLLNFTAGQSVAALELACEGFGGPYGKPVPVSDEGVSGTSVELAVAPSYTGGYRLACSALARASTGLASEASAFAVDVPAAAPSAPSSVAVSVENATRVTASLQFMPGQSVARAELNCSGHGGPHSAFASVNASDGAAAEASVALTVAPKYNGNYTLACTALVRGSTGLPSALAVPSSSVWVPAASPWGPLQLAVSVENATRATAVLRFMPGQSVAWAEVNCSGDGRLYSVAAAVNASDGAVAGANVSLTVEPKYSGNYSLTCTALVRASTGLQSAAVTYSDIATIPPASPWRPFIKSAAATNATRISVLLNLTAGQSVAALELACEGFGGPYEKPVPVSDTGASGTSVELAVAPLYTGGYRLACSALARASTGLASEASAFAVDVPAAAPSAPSSVAVSVENATRVTALLRFTPGQSVARAELNCSGHGGPYAAFASVNASDGAAAEASVALTVAPKYSGNYTLACTALVRGSTGLPSALAVPSSSVWVPAASPWDPLELAVSVENATRATAVLRFTPGQSVAWAEVNCSGNGRLYSVAAAVNASDGAVAGANVSLTVEPKYSGNYSLTCTALVRASTGLQSAAVTYSDIATIPPASPWRPFIKSAAATNATRISVLLNFTAGQSVAALELACEGFGGPYGKPVPVSDTGASGTAVELAVAPLYTGGYRLACSALARASIGLASEASAFAVDVPAAAPSAPSGVAVSVENATRVTALLRFTPGQSVARAELNCSGHGGPYAAFASVNASDGAAAEASVALTVAPKYSGNYTLACTALVRGSTGLPSALAVPSSSVWVPAASPWDPLELAVSVENATRATAVLRFTPGQSVAWAEVNCSGDGRLYSVAAAVNASYGAVAGANVSLTVEPKYSGNYSLTCTALVRASTGLQSAAVTYSDIATIPPASPWRPFIKSAAATNATRISVLLNFTAGQSVAALELACEGFSGPYGKPVPVSDTGASGTSVELAVAPLYTGGYRLACSALARASTGLASEASAFAVDVPAAAPSAPSSVAVSVENATRVTALLRFTPGQSVARAELNCSGHGGPYAAFAFVNGSDGAAAEASVALTVAPKYSGNYTLACTALVRGSTGLPSALAVPSSSVWVPAASPWDPLELAVSVENATRATAVLRFTPGQSVAWAEVNCSGDGRLYSVAAAVNASDGAVAGANVSLTVEPKYSGNYSLTCTALVRASTGLQSAAVTYSDIATIPPASPWRPFIKSAAATNATRISVLLNFTAGQSVAALELACEGFGGPYGKPVPVSDTGASGTEVELAVAPSYTGGYRLACSALARASTGLASEASAFAVDVPAAAPSAPSGVAVFVENATRVTAVLRFTPGQSVARVELNCSGHGGPYAAFAFVNGSDGAAAEASVALTVAPKYSGNYTLACTALVRGSTGLPSALAVPSSSVWVPAASPWDPLELAVSVENATRATAVLRFTPGQSVAWAEVNCSGDGRLYSVAAAVNASDGAVAGANVSLTVEPKYSGNYSLTCTALVRASTGLQSAAVTYSDIATIPPASPWRPFIKSAAATNATRISVLLNFTAGQSVAALELACEGFGGPYEKPVPVSDTGASGTSVELAVAPLYTGGYRLACSALARASTGLASEASAFAVDVPAAAPSGPSSVAVFVENATRVTALLRFTPGQSVARAELNCSGHGGPYAAFAFVNGSDGAAAEASVALTVASKYSGNYTLACTALVRGSTGLPSALAVPSSSVWVPAASPWDPLELAVSVENATRATAVLRFTPGQSVAWAEVNCSGDGRLYSVAAAVNASDGAVAGANVSLTVEPKYSGNYSLTCTTLVRASTGLQSAAVTYSDIATIPPASPWRPFIKSAAATNATRISVLLNFTAGQSVAALELACEGFGGPYGKPVPVSDTGASGTAVELAVAPSYTGGYRLACSALARASTGLASEASAFAVDVPAAAPSAPSGVAVSVENATRVTAVLRFTPGQSVARAELNCSGHGGPYYASALVNANDGAVAVANVSLTVAPKYFGNYTLACTALVRASAGLPSASVAFAEIATVPPASPWRPSVESAAATNATRVAFLFKFTAGQSVAALELACEGFSGPYARSVAVTDAGASGTAVELAIALSYTGGYRLACSTLARASTGLASETSSFAVDVPAATPWAPSDVVVVVNNATRVTAAVHFTPGQSVARAELNCSGHGGPYAAFASVNASDGAAAEASVALTVAPKYSGNYTLACAALVRGSTGLPSELAVPSGYVWVPAAVPAAPSANFVAQNSTLISANAVFGAGQSIVSVITTCDGFGGPYALDASVSGDFVFSKTLSISVLSSYNASYTLACSTRVRSSIDLFSPPVRSNVTVPVASPWAPAVYVQRAFNASLVELEVGIWTGQSVVAVDTSCTGSGGPYRVSTELPQVAAGPATVNVNVSVAVQISRAGSYVLSCGVAARSSLAVSQTTSLGPLVVPGVYHLTLQDVPAPASVRRQFVGSGVLFRSPAGRLMFTVLGGSFALDGTGVVQAGSDLLGDVYVLDVDSGAWTQAIVQQPILGRGTRCTWDRERAVYCAGGYKDGGAALSSSFWAFSTDFDAWVELPALPNPRTGHCVTVYDGRVWVMAGTIGVGGKSDLIAFSSEDRAWSTVVPDGQGGAPVLSSAACARVGSRWYSANADPPTSTSTVDVYEVDLAAPTLGFRRVARFPRAQIAATENRRLVLGSCHGALLAVEEGGPASLLEVAVGGAVEIAAAPPYSLDASVGLDDAAHDSDCGTCTTMISSGAGTPSRFVRLVGAIPLVSGNCSYPADGERRAQTLSFPPRTASTATPSATPPTTPSPSPPALPPNSTPFPSSTPAPPSLPSPTPSPSPAAAAATITLVLSVPATRAECEAYLRATRADDVSRALDALVYRFLERSGLPASSSARVRVDEIRCGSILFRLSLVADPAAPAAASTALAALVNLTRASALILPGLEDRTVESLANVSFVGRPPAGDVEWQLAEGAAIVPVSSSNEPAPPSRAAPTPPPSETGGAAAGGGASSSGSGSASAAGVAAGGAAAGVAALLAAVLLFVYVRRKRRARGASEPVSLGQAGLGVGSSDSGSGSNSGFTGGSLLQSTSASGGTGSHGATTVWIDMEYPPLTQVDVDLLAGAGEGQSGAKAPGKTGNGDGLSPGAARAVRHIPAPPEALLAAVREPLGLLGEGAFGRVYAVAIPAGKAAWVPAAEREAGALVVRRAVKEVALGDAAVAAREIHGASIQMACRHPNVLPVEIIFRDRFKLYIVLPLADMSLSALLASHPVLPESLALDFALQIASGLAYLHHELPQPVAHRDLKPQNILLNRKSDSSLSGYTLRVCDFGISRHVDTAKSLRGTLLYMPPETYGKDVVPTKTDVWAFGIVLTEMLTGARPHGGQLVAPEEVVKGHPFPKSVIASLPASLRGVVASCLEKKPHKRPSFVEIRATLEQIQRARAPPEPPAEIAVAVEAVPGPAPGPAAGPALQPPAVEGADASAAPQSARGGPSPRPPLPEPALLP